MNSSGTPDLITAAKKFVAALAATTGQPQNVFNVRLTAFFIGQQFSELARHMDCIYGDDKFAIAPEMKAWAASFLNGDCDERVRRGDRKCMLDTDIGMAWVAIIGAISQGADVDGAFDHVTKTILEKLDPVTNTILQGERDIIKWIHADMAPFINTGEPI